MVTFTLPKLPYGFDALEPHIDARTMEIHYTKHHQAYCDKFNAAIEAQGVSDQSVEAILSSVSKYSATVRNNGGGFWNHTFFWESMSKTGGGEPFGELLEAITSSFGSFEKFKEEFSKAAAGRFGSGWAWLGVKNDGKLVIFSTPNQDNPLMDVVQEDATLLLGLDVWEHAYYLKYQNKRPDYIAAFFNVINWEKVSQRFLEAKK